MVWPFASEHLAVALFLWRPGSVEAEAEAVPLTSYRTGVLANFSEKGFRKVSPGQATVFRWFSSKSQRVS